MNENDLYRILIAQISAGFIANQEQYNSLGDNDVLELAKIWANVIMKEKWILR